MQGAPSCHLSNTPGRAFMFLTASILKSEVLVSCSEDSSRIEDEPSWKVLCKRLCASLGSNPRTKSLLQRRECLRIISSEPTLCTNTTLNVHILMQYKALEEFFPPKPDKSV